MGVLLVDHYWCIAVPRITDWGAAMALSSHVVPAEKRLVLPSLGLKAGKSGTIVRLDTVNFLSPFTAG